MSASPVTVMRRADRLFEIIQILRASRQAETADRLATLLEVSPRTIYRDIAALQGMRTPIDGAAGVGYVLRAGYDLPPINLDQEEVEAILVGFGLLGRTGDPTLQQAAARVARKIDALREQPVGLHVSRHGAPVPERADPAMIRAAIRDERKLRIGYLTMDGTKTDRRIRPLAMVYYVEAAVLAAWCELRDDFRHFRLDRITDCVDAGAMAAGDGARLRDAWQRRDAGPR